MNLNEHAVNIFDKLADVYQQKYMDVSLYVDSLDYFCKSIQNKESEILDIACGPGNITKYLLNKNRYFKILGIDMAPAMISIAATNNPEAEFRQMNCADIVQLPKQFDAVVCGFCIPYLSIDDTRKLIKDISQILKPGGKLYLSTIEGEFDLSGFQEGSSGDKIFMHFYSKEFLVNSFEESFLRISKIQHIQNPANNVQGTRDIILIAEKNIP